MKPVVYAALLSVLLAACAQQPTKEAAIEERGQAGAQAAATAKEGMETRGMAAAGAEAKALEGTLRMPPKNAAGPLGQRTVYFDFDSAAIRDDSRGIVEAHAGFLKANGNAKVLLQGHADERGSREYNLALGQRRADSVKQAMSLLGVPEARMEAVSLGEEKPAVEGHDEAAWQKNRRAEIIYEGE